MSESPSSLIAITRPVPEGENPPDKPRLSFFLRRIVLTHFKNYGSRAFDCSPGITFILGNNGLGKTNLLDAIYYSCFTKSYLSSSDLSVPGHGSGFFRIESHFSIGQDPYLVEIKYLKNEKKEVLLNGNKVEKLVDFIGKFPCVIIVPDDNQLILGGSEMRRKFLDATLSQLYPEYLSDLVIYNKVLAQRNALLRSFYENRSFDAALLETYDERLIRHGMPIHGQRKAFVEKLLPLFSGYYRQLFDGNEAVSITYDSALNTADYKTLIDEQMQSDRLAQRTTKGIHTDDLLFEMNGHPLKKLGSQGQQKTFLLSLKLAQYKLLKAQKGMAPLLLLDDIFDKLDRQRITAIFRLISSPEFGQVFITDTNKTLVEAMITELSIENYKMITLGEVQE